MLSEAMVRHVVGIDGARALIEIVQGAWDDYVQENRFRFHRSTRANIVWDYMVIRSDALLAEADGVKRVLREERPVYILRDLFALRPKMHTRDGLTQNYATSAQRRLQDTGLLGDIPTPLLAFGYVLDAAEAGIQQCVVTSPSDDWIIDLDDLAAGNLAPIKGMLDFPDFEEAWRQVDPIRLRAAN
jgi:hypothetical protein